MLSKKIKNLILEEGLDFNIEEEENGRCHFHSLVFKSDGYYHRETNAYFNMEYANQFFWWWYGGERREECDFPLTYNLYSQEYKHDGEINEEEWTNE